VGTTMHYTIVKKITPFDISS